MATPYDEEQPEDSEPEADPDCAPGVEVPGTEVCGDLLDNDCDGEVDEGCPPRAECNCAPDSWRYCDPVEYSLQGAQFCLADGRGWGPCVEYSDVPEECSHLEGWFSPQLSECLIDIGYCVQDVWDRDHDTDTWESVGICEEPLCP